MIPISVKNILFLLLLIGSQMAFTQENCINGIDDDGDGLIDINDPDCICCDGVFGNIIENSQFEDMSCCLFSLSCYDFWDPLQTTTSDVFHSCQGAPPVYLPLPIPAAGVVASAHGAGFPDPEGFYQCLTNCLSSNTDYTLSFDYYSYDIINGAAAMANEIGMEVYGIPLCGDANSLNFQCPFSGNMDLLFQHVLPPNPFNTWLNMTINITTLQNYQAVVFVGSCAPTTILYTYLGNISLTTSVPPALTADPPIFSGNDCIGYTFEILNIPPGVTIQWYIDGIAVVGEDQPIFNLPVGVYGDVSYGFFDAPSCAFSEPIEILPGATLQINPTIIEIACFGDNSGSISLAPTDGPPPYIYNWSNSSTSNPISNLGPGTYTVTVTDDNGCTATGEYIMTEPTDLMGNITNITPVDPVTGFGSATAIGVGGTPAYTYNWDSGETMPTASNLVSGVHYVTITDNNGCEEILEVIIPNTPLSFEISNVQNTCNGFCDGNVQVQAIGGSDPVDIIWDDPTLSGFQEFNLCAGYFSFTIVDNDGNSIIGDFTIDNFPLMAVSSTLTNPTCNDTLAGEIDITVETGDGPFSYEWSNLEYTEDISGLNNGTYFITVTDQHQCSLMESFTIFNEFLISPDISITPNKCVNDSLAIVDVSLVGQSGYSILWGDGNTDFFRDSLPSDTLQYTITENSSGCLAINTVIIPSPQALSYGYTASDTICQGTNDGLLAIDTIGFQDKKYSFLWENNSNSVIRDNLPLGQYFVVVTDSLGCSQTSELNISEYVFPPFSLNSIDPDCNIGNNGVAFINDFGDKQLTYLWSNNITNDTISNLTSGIYTITITDGNNCLKEDTIMLDQKSSVDLDSTVVDEICANDNNGSIALTPINGTIKSYAWSNSQSSPKIKNLSAGVYSVTITDENDCTTIEEFVINDGAIINYSSSIIDEICFGQANGSIDLGFSSNYTVAWSNTLDDTASNQNLESGIYTAMVTDSNGCELLDTFIVNEGAIIEANSSILPITCKDDLASITINLTNPVGNYTALWSNGSMDFMLEYIPAGTYWVEIKDEDNCTLHDTFIIDDGISFDYTSTIQSNNCPNINEGEISINTTDPNTYEWSNGSDQSTISDLIDGEFMVTITDITGQCETIDTFIIASIPLSNYDLNIVDALCFGDQNGGFNLSTIASSIFINGNSSSVDTLLSAGDFLLAFRDENNCLRDTFFSISQPPVLESTISSLPISCFDVNNGAASISVNGGVPGYTYLWSNGSADNQISNLFSDTYQVTISDENSCQTINDITILPFEQIITDFSYQNILCDDANLGSISLSIENGFAPNFYLNQEGPYVATLFDELALGSYQVSYQYSLDCIEDLYQIDIQQAEANFEVSIQEEGPGYYTIDESGTITINYIDPNEITEINITINGESVCEANMTGLCLTVDHIFDEENVIIATALDDNFCLKSDTLFITLISPSGPIDIPNVFSPNNDGVNDVWNIQIPSNSTLINALVYDRWGNKVFHSTDPNSFIWDGKFNGSNLQPGVYVYVIDLLNNSTSTSKLLKGDITLVR